MQESPNQIPHKMVEIDFAGQHYSLAIKTTPFTASDDLWVESRKLVYLSLVGAVRADEHLYRKARSLATFELITLAGIPAPTNMTGNMPPGVDPVVLGVSALPVQVVNQVVKQYFDQFRFAESDDPLAS